MENFEVQVAPVGLNKFLGIKSGGQQISELVPEINPVLDLREFLYDPVFCQPNFAAGGAAQQFALGSAGVYRIRGNAYMSGINGINAGDSELRVEVVDQANSSLPVPQSAVLVVMYAVASTGLFNGNVYFDFFLDATSLPLGSHAKLEFTFNTTTAPTVLSGGATVMAQRVF